MNVNLSTITGTRRFITTSTSRRGLLASATAGLLAARQLAEGGAESAAKKKGKRKKKRKNRSARTSVTATCSGPGFRINTGGDRRLAQPFVAPASGPLVRATLEIDKRSSSDGAGDYILRLSPVDDSGVPTTEVLAESVVADARVPEGPSSVIFDFTKPFSVEAETAYALVLARPESDQFAVSGDFGDRCAGQLFFSAAQTGDFRAFEPAVEARFTAFVRSRA